MSQLGQQEPLLNSNCCSISTFSESNLRFLTFLNLILGSGQAGKQIPRRKLMSKSLTRLNEGYKHEYFQSVCGLRMVTLFRLSWMSARSSWIAVSNHAQALPSKVSQDLDCVHTESYVHNSTQIRLGSLKRVLPENRMMDACDV